MKSEWIPVTDRMPEKETLVIVAVYENDIIIPENGETVEDAIRRIRTEIVRTTMGFVGSDGWYDCDGYPMVIAPSYWMPLPEPPKEQKPPAVS